MKLCTAMCDKYKWKIFSEGQLDIYSLGEEISCLLDSRFYDLSGEGYNACYELYTAHGEPIIEQYLLEHYGHHIQRMLLSDIDDTYSQWMDFKPDGFFNYSNSFAYELVKKHGVETQVEKLEALIVDPMKPAITGRNKI